MRRASMLAAMLCPASLCLESSGQSSQAASGTQDRGAKDQPTLDPAPVQHPFRPKLSMQDALKIAESYIDKQHIDISSYWLYRAIFILYGDKNTADTDKTPCWHFWWTSDTGALGDYVEILVDMDGRAWRVPSM